MGITAKSRSTTALQGSTTLAPAAVLDAVKGVAGDVRGGGKSLLTTGVANLGAQVHVMRESGNSIKLSITSGKKLVELCTFSATASADGDSTQVRVGGLDTYKTQQKKLWYLIPVGPKQIYGMDPYKRFLTAVADRIRTLDPAAQLTVAQPEG
jgi:hypothetical protein